MVQKCSERKIIERKNLIKSVWEFNENCNKINEKSMKNRKVKVGRGIWGHFQWLRGAYDLIEFAALPFTAKVPEKSIVFCNKDVAPGVDFRVQMGRN